MNVEVEADCQSIVHNLTSEATDHTELGRLINQCRSILLAQPHITVSFVRRSGNKLAHELARRSCFLYIPLVGIGPPTWCTNDMLYACSEH
ncbi:hypothetical protein LINGRAHAP2_LOCUS32126 [Linum grandiflorum]